MPVIEAMSDEELVYLNDLLPWSCFVLDSHGRRFGAPTRPGKRTEPQSIPDSRIVELDRRVGLSGKKVLEIGCFEGIHTAGLCGFGAEVEAVDSRVELVSKTVVRCSLMGLAPSVHLWNAEEPPPFPERVRNDVTHHVGVLYHLKDPVAHLEMLCPLIGHTLMLDTHIATPADSLREYQSANGKTYSYRKKKESGREEPFSGMYDHSKWLLEETVCEILREQGFDSVDVAERRDEKNGARILLFAGRD